MRQLAAAALAVLLVGCSDEPPEVDWGQIPEAEQRSIDRAVEDGDCAAMQAAFDHSEEADVLAYLDWHLEDAGCY